jgi:hypothetical protein
MTTQNGQAILETIVVVPILLLGGAIMVTGAHLISEKSILTALATERAQILSASELQWTNWENLKSSHPLLKSTANLRFYATPVNSPVPGVSVQINACVPIVGISKTTPTETTASTSASRTCLGMFESAPTLSLLRSGVVRIRVSAFAPRQLSHSIFHQGLPFTEADL